MQTKITVSRAAHTGQSEEVARPIGDTIQANADLQAQLAASYESIALLEQELAAAQAARWTCASCSAEFAHVPGDADVLHCTKCVEVEVLAAERLTWLRANNEVAALNIDLIVELSDLKDAVRAYLSAPISRRGVCWARLKELTKDE